MRIVFSWSQILSTALIVFLFVGVSLLSSLYQHQLYDLVAFEGWYGMVAYTLLTAGAIIIAPFSTLPLIPIASHMWGWGAAALLSIVGWVVGSQIAFLIARSWGKPIVEKFISINHVSRFETYFDRERLFWTVVLLRLTVPVDVFSYALGLFSRMNARDFFLSTLIGVAPFAFVFVYIGTLPLSLQLFAFIEVASVIVAIHVVRNQRDVRRALLFLALLTAGFCLWVFRAEAYANVKMLEAASATHPLSVGLSLIGLKSILAPLGFPGAPLTLLSGSVFGIWWGTLIALIGNTLGAALAFLASRYIFYDWVQQTIMKEYPRVHAFEDRMREHGFSTVVLLRLIPLFPFNALNFVLGITTISFRNYMIGSFVGMIPGTFLFVYVGDSIARISPLNIGISIIGLFLITYVSKRYAAKLS